LVFYLNEENTRHQALLVDIGHLILLKDLACFKLKQKLGISKFLVFLDDPHFHLNKQSHSDLEGFKKPMSVHL